MNDTSRSTYQSLFFTFQYYVDKYIYIYILHVIYFEISNWQKQKYIHVIHASFSALRDSN